jgi:hypothetical protein
VITLAGRSWRGGINQILYTLMFVRRLDNEAVDNVARAIVERGVLSEGPAAYYDSIAAALKTTEQLTGDIETPHDDVSFRDFLHRLLTRLDALRPWPEPTFTKLPIAEWDTFAHGRAIARLENTTMNVQDRLRERFEKLPVGEGNLVGLILQLKSGQAVALMGSYEPGNRVTLLQRDDSADPEATIDAFVEATGFPREKITPVH